MILMAQVFLVNKVFQGRGEQMVNISDFVGYTVSDTTTQLCHCTKAAIDNV